MPGIPRYPELERGCEVGCGQPAYTYKIFWKIFWKIEEIIWWFNIFIIILFYGENDEMDSKEGNGANEGI